MILLIIKTLFWDVAIFCKTCRGETVLQVEFKLDNKIRAFCMYATLNTRLEKLHIFKLREKILFILSIKMQTLFKSNLTVKCFIFIFFFPHKFSFTWKHFGDWSISKTTNNTGYIILIECARESCVLRIPHHKHKHIHQIYHYVPPTLDLEVNKEDQLLLPCGYTKNHQCNLKKSSKSSYNILLFTVSKYFFDIFIQILF